MQPPISGRNVDFSAGTMTSEVVGAEVGVLRMQDVRAALGDVLHMARQIDVVVVATTGAPFAGTVCIARKAAGRGEHVALRCPLCLRARLVLYAQDGALRCGHCARRRTRRALERTCRDWNRLGGREEDALLRAARRRLPDVELMARRAADLAIGDVDRARVAVELTETALEAVEEQWNAMNR